MFLSHRIFEYRGPETSWYLDLEGGPGGVSEAKWGQRSYYANGVANSIEGFASVEGMKKIDELEINSYFNRRYISFDAVFDAPQNLTTLLDGYFGLSDEDKKAFLSSCALFEQGVEAWSMYPSLSFVGLVSCLETLINADNKGTKVETCKECNQDRHRVVKKFRDFFQRYGNDSKEFKEYALKIYKYRSRVVHTGELFHGEVMPEKFASGERIDVDEFRRSVIRTCRVCMVNWINSRVKARWLAEG